MASGESLRIGITCYPSFGGSGVLAAALGVSACGRKGALDAPPGGLAANPTGSLDEETDEGGEVVRRGTARGLPIIRGPDRRIPLDVLLD